MTIDANGKLILPYTWETDRVNNIKVRSDRMDTQDQAVVDGVDAQMDRAGKKTPTANISWNSKKITNLANGTADADAINKGQLDDAIENISEASTTTKGIVELATNAETLNGASAVLATTPSGVMYAIQQSIINSGYTVPFDYIGGCITTIDSGDADHDINISVGQARDATDSSNMILSSALVKRIDASWVEGTDNGGFPSGLTLTANTKYNIFLISTDTVDATAGKFETVDISSKLAAFKAISDGFIRITIDGTNRDLTGLDFTSALSFTDVATIMNSALIGGICTYTAGIFKVTSNSTGASSTVNMATISGGSGTDLSTVTYFSVSTGTATPGTDLVNGLVDAGFDSSDTAVNLLSDAADDDYVNYRKIGQIYASTALIIKSLLSSTLRPDLEDRWEWDGTDTYTKARWYEVYKDGKIRQGGSYNPTSTVRTITYDKPFTATTSYVLHLQYTTYIDTSTVQSLFGNKATTGFEMYGVRHTGSTSVVNYQPFDWIAEGR
jgi:hypothetical protein